MIPGKIELFDACLEWDSTLLRTTNDHDFIATAQYLSQGMPKGYLQRLVEATGIENISAAARGACLWVSTHSREATDYWIKIIESDPTIEPNYTYKRDERAGSSLFEVLSFSRKPDRLIRLATVLMKFQEPLLRQMQNVVSATEAASLVSSLFLFLCRFKRFSSTEGLEAVDTLVSTFFIPSCKKAVQLGGYPTSQIVSAFWRLVDDTPGVAAQDLFMLCASLDDIKSSVHLIADAIRNALVQNREAVPQVTFIACCIEAISEHVEAAALNKIISKSHPPKNLMDHILSPGVAGQLESKSETIHRLVQRGGRVSHPEPQDPSHAHVVYCLYDVEGMELYREAVRVAERSSPNTHERI
jgi:hypothetical protein